MGSSVADVLAHFRRLSAIPRPSKHEQKAADWICDWAAERGLPVLRDKLSNLVIQVPGTGDGSGATVVVQAHLDMVCEATPETAHDCVRDPIEVREENGWLTANGTTLGADNGIAVAMALSLADDDDLVHPPLELLFTVDEETGLNGAKALTPDLLVGRTLLNIDSEEEGAFTVGCAGGQDTTITLPVHRATPPSTGFLLSVSVGGLPGGHSGVDINRSIANADILLAALLDRISAVNPIRLVSFTGGSAHNAIPRDASATIWATSLSGIDESIEAVRLQAGHEFPDSRPDFRVASLDSSAERPMTVEATGTLISLLLALPHGVDRMTDGVQDLVETSSNLATVRTAGEEVTILTSQRSSVEARLQSITRRIGAVARLAGAAVSNSEGYPPWEPDFDSPLVSVACTVYSELFGKKAAVDVIHAGLECGVIGAIYPGMEMISFGPTIEGAHSPSERLDLASLERTWRFCRALLEGLAL